MTPLMRAVSSGSYDQAIMLVEAGADWENPRSGISNRIATVLCLLVDKANEPMPVSAYGANVYASYLKLIKTLEEKGADFDDARAYREFYEKESVRLFGRSKEDREKIARRIDEEYERYKQKQQLKKEQEVNE
jgi:hypothetical protein